MIEVLHPGALSTIQDLGRPGLAHLGIPRSGAADRRSLRLANRLVGNPESAAAIEATLIGPTLRFLTDTTIALAGAVVQPRSHAAEQIPMNAPVHCRAGDELALGNALSGVRTYVAVAGGIDVAPVLGSASTDLLTGVGPRPLARGDRLAVGAAPASTRGDRLAIGAVPAGTRGDRLAIGPVSASEAPTPGAPPPIEPSDDRGVMALSVVLGPRADWFSAESVRTFLRSEFEVTASSNRVGLRLSGPALAREGDDELQSEGLVPGAIQVPPDGQPIVMLVDHPTTGGYPVIAVAMSVELCTIAQLRPGRRVRFAAVDAP